MTYSDPTQAARQARAEQLLADPLSHLFSVEELDQAADILERLAAVREAENRVSKLGNPDASGGLAANRDLYTAAEQLRAAQRFRAIPADALEHLRWRDRRDRAGRDE